MLHLIFNKKEIKCSFFFFIGSMLEHIGTFVCPMFAPMFKACFMPYLTLINIYNGDAVHGSILRWQQQRFSCEYTKNHCGLNGTDEKKKNRREKFEKKRTVAKEKHLIIQQELFNLSILLWLEDTTCSHSLI